MGGVPPDRASDYYHFGLQVDARNSKTFILKEINPKIFQIQQVLTKQKQNAIHAGTLDIDKKFPLNKISS